MNFDAIIRGIDYVILIYLILMCFIFFTFVIAASLSFSKYIKTKDFMENFKFKDSQSYIPVSLLVPAYNEEVTICNTIESLVNLKYNEYEIVVISDGSRDNTVEVVLENYDLERIYKPMKKNIETKDIMAIYKGKKKNVSITLIDKENGGKADALNVGINYSRYPIFIAIDADSMLQNDSIEKIVIPFMENEKTVAVGGNVKIANYVTIRDGKVVDLEKPKGLIVSFQVIEYLRAFLTNRVAWNILNMNLIISGAFGAFNKKVIIDVGGYKSDTVGEDMELVMRIHKHFLKKKEKYYISFAPDANCYTQAPDTLKGLKVQRRRWQIGLIHSLAIHKSMFIDKKWFLAKAYFIFFELITPIIEIFGLFIIILSIILDIINLKFLIAYYAALLIYGLGISIAAILLEVYVFDETINRKVLVKLLLVAPLEAVGYRQLVNIYRISAFIGYRKNKHKWGSINRKKQKA